MSRKPTHLPDGTRISDHVTLGVLTATVPADLIDAVLTDTGRQSRRQRQLPARLVVYYVMALALYAQASYGEVLRCLLEGVRWLYLGGLDLALASKSAITKARACLGVAPLKLRSTRDAGTLRGMDVSQWAIDLKLHPADQRRLESLVHNGNTPQKLMPRARIALLSDGTRLNGAIARERCLCPPAHQAADSRFKSGAGLASCRTASCP
jgi:hypothetical protein